MEIFVWVVLGIIVIVAETISLSFSFPNEANKPVFWIISPAVLMILGIIVYLVVRRFNL